MTRPPEDLFIGIAGSVRRSRAVGEGKEELVNYVAEFGHQLKKWEGYGHIAGG